jgi:hypothetical protein
MSLNVEGESLTRQDENSRQDNEDDTNVEDMEVEEEGEPRAPVEHVEASGIVNTPATSQTTGPEANTPPESNDITEPVTPVQGMISITQEVRLVLHHVPVDSPNEFRDESKAKFSKRAKISKSPLKSPEKDDDVSVELSVELLLVFLEFEPHLIYACII